VASCSTNLNKNINLHFRNIYADTYLRLNLLVLVPVQIVTVLGIESMPRQASYLAQQHYFWLTDNKVRLGRPAIQRRPCSIRDVRSSHFKSMSQPRNRSRELTSLSRPMYSPFHSLTVTTVTLSGETGELNVSCFDMIRHQLQQRIHRKQHT
jgi:hypothetical protein